MNDPIQMLIDAGAIPSTPFVAQSRYHGVGLAVLQRRAEEPALVYVRRRFLPAPATITIAGQHQVGPLDRPDVLGARYFADPLLYWLIADANLVIDPNQLTDTVGRRVLIPTPQGM